MKSSAGPLAVLAAALLCAFPARAQDETRCSCSPRRHSRSLSRPSARRSRRRTRRPQSSGDFAGSPALVAQIESGAPADVIATADAANMATARKGLLLGGAADLRAQPARDHGRNGNPKDIKGWPISGPQDLSCPRRRSRARRALSRARSLKAAGVAVRSRSQRGDVKAVAEQGGDRRGRRRDRLHDRRALPPATSVERRRDPRRAERDRELSHRGW